MKQIQSNRTDRIDSEIRLLALNSSYSHTNLAVRCIAKSLRTAGFAVQISEFNIKDKRRRILEALAAANAGIYGFSAYIWNIREMLSLASDLARLRPEALIVFGGPEVSYGAQEILAENPFIDGIITGEGERAWVELARRHAAGERIPPIIDGGIFDGFAHQGMVYEETDARGRMVYYESARGCPFRCAYCLSALSGGVRAKSAAVTLAELQEFEKTDGIKIIKFVDRTFNFDRERAKKIWRGLLSDAYTKNYHFEICADLLDEEAFALLEKFPRGKIQLEIGVQSTNPATLARVRRSSKTDTLIRNLARLHELGNMHIHADLIAGLPGEDFESFGRSFDALWGKCDMLQLGFLKLLGGSVLRRDAHTFGCVYSDTPPYEVLATDCLSFEELCRLHDIDDLLDRYANSGAFSRTMTLLTQRATSPFRLFCNLAACFQEDGLRIAELPQPRAYLQLYTYLHDGEDAALAERLILDFLTHQTLPPPRIGEMELVRLEDDTRRRFMKFADDAGIAYFAPALEARRGSHTYIIDRRNLRAFMERDGDFAEI